MKRIFDFLKKYKYLFPAFIFVFVCLCFVCCLASCHTFSGNDNTYDNTHTYIYKNNCLLIDNEPVVEYKAIALTTALLIGAGLIAGGSIASSAISSSSQEKINKQNKENVEKENAITREREDNAVQRRVEDLKIAGLSPTLAAGSAASAQALMPYQQTNNPLGDFAKALGESPQTFFKALQVGLNIRGQMSSIAQTDAATNLANTQQAVALSQKNFYDKQGSYYDAMTAGKVIDNSINATYGLKQAGMNYDTAKTMYNINQQNLTNSIWNFHKAQDYNLPVGVAPYNSNGNNVSFGVGPKGVSFDFGNKSSSNQPGTKPYKFNNFSLLDYLGFYNYLNKTKNYLF